MTSGKRIKYDRAVLIAEAYDAGVKIKAIALEHAISESSVTRIARRYGCTLRGAPQLGHYAVVLDGGGRRYVNRYQPVSD